MSHAYNKAKKRRRHSAPKQGHQIRRGEHIWRARFGEKMQALSDFYEGQSQEMYGEHFRAGMTAHYEALKGGKT